jgi:succinyl-diaminopimelate desuccinylase
MYGRGACDMKGGVASEIIALWLLKQSGLPFNGKCQIWLVPDEEIDGPYGAKFLTKHSPEVVKADATVIAEPTGELPVKNPVVIIGEKGSIWLRFRFFGAAGHGSMPKPKSNSINKANHFIQNMKKMRLPKIKAPFTLKDMLKGLLSRFKFKDLVKALTTVSGEPDPYDEDGPGIGSFFNTTYSFDQIHAGTKVNVIPDVCDLEVDFRILPGITFQELLDDIVGYCTKIGYRIELPSEYSNIQKQDKKMQKRPIDIELSLISVALGTIIEKESPFLQLFAKTFEELYHVKALNFFAPGSSDATHLRLANLQNVIVFGPSGGHAHDTNEYVNMDQIILTCKVYLLTAYRFLKNQ